MMEEAQGSKTTIEIRVLTLDSHTYNLSVDKHVPVPALKQQIASVTGVLSEQQRLLCRGKVLKDDQLLSAYNVEDGHTLHLVVRQQVPPPLSSSSDIGLQNPAADTSSSFVMEAYSSGDQEGDGVTPQISHIVTAVLSSLGLSDSGSGMRGQYEGPQHSGFGLATSRPLETQFFPPVIPNSLITLSQYLSHMRTEFDALREENVQFDGMDRTEERNSTTTSAMSSSRFPTPASLAQLMLSTRQILEQAGTCLVQLARQMEDQENVNDRLSRMITQVSAYRTGLQIQNLGAYLLELGRTTLTVQIGDTPDEAVVNSGPAVFISPSGPNPLTVQPQPQPLSFQPGTSFGAIPMETRPPGSDLVDQLDQPDIVIHIQRGSSMDENLGNQTTSMDENLGNQPTSMDNINNQESDSSYFEYLRSLSHGGETNLEDASLQGMATGSVSEHVGTSSDPVEAEPRVADEGIFLCNLLHEIMPHISQNLGAESNVVPPAETHTSEDRMVQDSSTQAQNSQIGTSHRRSDTEPSSPNSKRQKME